MTPTDASPEVTVCIANYNGEHLLPECIESVLQQTTPERIEIIVHDDASTDGSLELLASRYPQARVIRSERNVGFCLANNRMAASARGRYLLLLNNDAALAEDAIQTLLRAARDIDGPAILTLPQMDWATGTQVDRGCLLDPFLNPVPNADPDRSDVAYVIGACLWCPRDTWKELGGFPEWMESIGEDLYLCGKARLKGIPVRTADGSHYRHRQGATFGGNRADSRLSTSVRRRALSERNKTLAMLVLSPGFSGVMLFGLHLLLLLVEGVVLATLKRNPMLLTEVYLPSLTAPARNLGNLLACRRRVQTGRLISVRAWHATTCWRLRKLELLFRYGLPEVR